MPVENMEAPNHHAQAVFFLFVGVRWAPAVPAIGFPVVLSNGLWTPGTCIVLIQASAASIMHMIICIIGELLRELGVEFFFFFFVPVHWLPVNKPRVHNNHAEDQ